ncbi:hypothetical protein [uncultured Pseudoflavonifractor sp.]|uniref:hypothetical protein n=1 Tax=uncultured Pseudoflavonifractor sp. TaxID=1221379 RepID=UPI0025D1A755|nr:hypothetical protein [uncultured Pseudoflavonifractor sp.]
MTSRVLSGILSKRSRGTPLEEAKSFLEFSLTAQKKKTKKPLDKAGRTWYHIKVRCEGGGRLDESSGFELLELKSSEKSLKKVLDSNKKI